MGLREGRTSQGGRRTPLGPAVHTIKRDDPAHVPAGTSSQRSPANAFARGGLSCHASRSLEELARPQHGVHHDRELSGDGDGGTLEADPFLELEPPCLERALSWGSPDRTGTDSLQADKAGTSRRSARGGAA